MTSKDEYYRYIPKILPLLNEQSKFWISYRKSHGKVVYDINRDTFFKLAEEFGLRAYANVALDDVWSCVGLKKSSDIS